MAGPEHPDGRGHHFAGIATELFDEIKVAARMDRVIDIINTSTMLKVKAKIVGTIDTVKAP